MLLLIIFAIFLVLAVVTIVFSDRGAYMRTRIIKYYGFLFFLCTIVFCCISFFVDSNKENIVEFSDKAELAQTIEIECLNDNLNTTGKISGNIFSVKGYEKTEQYYYYIYDVSGKGKTTGKIPADITYVNTDSLTDEKKPYEKKPYIEKYVYKPIDEELSCIRLITWHGLGIPFNTDNIEKVAYYKLYVYEDSITSDYVIDLKN